MGVSTGLTGRSKNLDPTQPASRPDRFPSLNHLVYHFLITIHTHLASFLRGKTLKKKTS